VENQWVFGGIERSGKIFLVPVEKRDRDILTEIIVKWIKPRKTKCQIAGKHMTNWKKLVITI